MAADRLRPLSPALGQARGLSAAPCDKEGGAEASRGSPLAPGENRIGASGRVLTPGLRQGRTGNSSRNSRGLVTSWLRTPPATCSNHGRDDARPLLRRDHRSSACRGSAKSTPYHGGLRSRAWAFQMGWSQMTESGSTATPKKKYKKKKYLGHPCWVDVPA